MGKTAQLNHEVSYETEFKFQVKQTSADQLHTHSLHVSDCAATGGKVILSSVFYSVYLIFLFNILEGSGTICTQYSST